MAGVELHQRPILLADCGRLFKDSKQVPEAALIQEEADADSLADHLRRGSTSTHSAIFYHYRGK